MRKAGSSGAWRRFGTAVAFALWVAVATLFLLELIATYRKAFGVNGSKAFIIKPWVGILVVGNRLC